MIKQVKRCLGITQHDLARKIALTQKELNTLGKRDGQLEHELCALMEQARNYNSQASAQLSR